MPKREWTTLERCSFSGCSESARYVFDTLRERDQYERDRGDSWRCARHTKPHQVLSVDQQHRTGVLVCTERTFGKFWYPEGKTSGSGACHGPGFIAFAHDFPAGTRLVVTARIELPEEATA